MNKKYKELLKNVAKEAEESAKRYFNSMFFINYFTGECGFKSEIKESDFNNINYRRQHEDKK